MQSSTFVEVDIPTTVIVLTNSSLLTTDSEYRPKANYSVSSSRDASYNSKPFPSLSNANCAVTPNLSPTHSNTLIVFSNPNHDPDPKLTLTRTRILAPNPNLSLIHI